MRAGGREEVIACASCHAPIPRRTIGNGRVIVASCRQCIERRYGSVHELSVRLLVALIRADKEAGG